MHEGQAAKEPETWRSGRGVGWEGWKIPQEVQLCFPLDGAKKVINNTWTLIQHATLFSEDLKTIPHFVLYT